MCVCVVVCECVGRRRGGRAQADALLRAAHAQERTLPGASSKSSKASKDALKSTCSVNLVKLVKMLKSSKASKEAA